MNKEKKISDGGNKCYTDNYKRLTSLYGQIELDDWMAKEGSI